MTPESKTSCNNQPSQRLVELRRLPNFVWQQRKSLIFLLYLIGISSVFLLPLSAIRGSSDEKALLLGVTKPSIASAARRVGKQYQNVKSSQGKEFGDWVISSWESYRGADEGLVQKGAIDWTNLTLNDGCQTVHSVVEGTRSDGTESIVIALPLGGDVARETAAFGMTLAHVLLGHLQEQKWLAKNVIFLLMDGSSCSPLHSSHAWLEYVVDSWTPDRRFGQIQQAFVFDIQSPEPHEAWIQVHGLNGQVPNFDLYMIARSSIEFFSSFSVRVDGNAFGNALSFSGPQADYLNQVLTLGGYMMYQGLGIPNGAHAAFLSRGIDALTISFLEGKVSPSMNGTGSNGNRATSNKATHILQVGEMVVRTANNLQEKLHHATALYALSGSYAVIEISTFMIPPVALLLSQVLLTASTCASCIEHAASIRWWRSIGFGTLAVVFLLCPLFILKSMNQTLFVLEKKIDWVETRECLESCGGLLVFGYAFWKFCSNIVEQAVSMSVTTRPPKDARMDMEGTRAAFSMLVTSLSFSAILWRWSLCWMLLAILVPLQKM